MNFKNSYHLLFHNQQTYFPQNLRGTQAALGPAQRHQCCASCCSRCGAGGQATLTFGNDIQDHIERDKPSDHKQESSLVHEGELGGSVAIIEEPDDQGPQTGLCPMDEESWQVSEVVGNLTT